MGRYATFDTGLDYKFAFGIQESLDITEFYGEWIKDCEEYVNDITWTAEEDKEKILLKLEDLQKENPNLPKVLQIELYKPSLQGTYDLMTFFCENEPKREVETDFTPKDNEKIFYKYFLGYLIYHQLCYTEMLGCEFEL